MISTLTLFLFSQTNLLLLLLLRVESICLNNGNYTRSSAYANNLNTALSYLPDNIGTTGFYTASVGSHNPDIANVLALCRADLHLLDCRECLRGITDTLLTSCPDQKQAVDWTELCMLRYSNESILGVLQTQPAIRMWSPLNATSPSGGGLMDNLRRHLDTLRGRAAGSGPTRKVAAGNGTGEGEEFQVIYALLQCTPDLSPNECNGCLFGAYQDMRRICCAVRVGAIVNTPSCNLRYEFYQFYNETRLRELAEATAPDSPRPAGTNRTRNTIVYVVSIVACVILTASVCVLLRKRMKRKTEETREIFEAINEMITAESLKYDLSTIRAATNDFSDDNKLGRGGFGAVYRGKLSNGQEIAVKRLSLDSGQGGVEFKNEVLLLARLQHRNLVQLLGFCLEGAEKLLIYEFVENASLDHFIFEPVKRALLDWEKRYKIISGIARGILYLHEDSKLRIIHRDLKPSNVLLDGAMNPKIADFGMARLFRQDETQGSTTKIAGTFGYMAPEYVTHGQFSVKSDVFSFGVLILEIISGEKNNGPRRGENSDDLLSLAWENWHEGTVGRIVDPCLRTSSDSTSHMERCFHIGLLCVQEKAADRPTMTSVLLMLNSSSLALAAPTKPAFYMHSGYVSVEHGSSSQKAAAAQSDNSSRNEVSITDLHPR